MSQCLILYTQWIIAGFSTFFLVSGCLLIFLWENFFNSILHKELTLANTDTEQYKNWIETPIDITLEMYLFNLTNSEEFEGGKKWVKPRFEEVGPYPYAERHTRSNVIFNPNHTISFNTIRTWKFQSDKTNRTLDDKITIFSPIVIAVANVVKKKHFLIRRGVHYFFKEKNVTLFQTKTVREFMFEGVSDPLIDLALKLHIKDYEIPFDKFGWFYARNGSESYDGNYTMWTGEDDIMKTGIINQWDQSPKSRYYEGQCGRIDGSTGEVWNPTKNAQAISMFVSDICSLFTFERNGSQSSQGIDGNLYVSTEKLFDNGEKYPEMACFSPHERLPSGVRDISACKYKAPVYISLPHFNMADQSYRDNVEGMHPDPVKHKLYMLMEPDLGLPLEVQAVFQGNVRMFQVDGIDVFQNVKDTMIPLIWAKVHAGVPESMAFELKLVIAAPKIGTITGYVFVALSIVLCIYVTYKILHQNGKINFK